MLRFLFSISFLAGLCRGLLLMLFCLDSTSLCTLSLHANASRHCKRTSHAKCHYQASVGFFLSPRRSLFRKRSHYVFVGRNLVGVLAFSAGNRLVRHPA